LKIHGLCAVAGIPNYLDLDGHIDNTAGYWKDGAASLPFDTNGNPAIRVG
jgi:hypothetical protein